MCQWVCEGRVVWRFLEFPSEPLPLPNPNLLLARNCLGSVHPFLCFCPATSPLPLSPSGADNKAM